MSLKQNNMWQSQSCQMNIVKRQQKYLAKNSSNGQVLCPYITKANRSLILKMKVDNSDDLGGIWLPKIFLSTYTEKTVKLNKVLNEIEGKQH